MFVGQPMTAGPENYTTAGTSPDSLKYAQLSQNDVLSIFNKASGVLGMFPVARTGDDTTGPGHSFAGFAAPNVDQLQGDALEQFLCASLSDATLWQGGESHSMHSMHATPSTLVGGLVPARDPSTAPLASSCPSPSSQQSTDLSSFAAPAGLLSPQGAALPLGPRAKRSASSISGEETAGSTLSYSPTPLRRSHSDALPPRYRCKRRAVRASRSAVQLLTGQTPGLLLLQQQQQQAMARLVEPHASPCPISTFPPELCGLQQVQVQVQQLQQLQQQQQQEVMTSLRLPGTAAAWWQQLGEQHLQQQEADVIDLHLQQLLEQATLDQLQPNGTGLQPAGETPLQRSQSSSFSELVLRELQLVEQQGAQLQPVQGAGPTTAHQ